jgi:hypothetical protein
MPGARTCYIIHEKMFTLNLSRLNLKESGRFDGQNGPIVRSASQKLDNKEQDDYD